MILCTVGLIVLGLGGWSVDGMVGVPPGGFRDVGILPNSFAWVGGGTAKTEWLGVMDHQHMQDKVGRGG